MSRLKKEPRTDVAIGIRMQRFCEALQKRICRELETLDPKATWTTDRWKREGGGGGITRVVSGGAVFEKGGVNTSAVHGSLPKEMAAVMNVRETRFFATGLSLVLHPRSPHVPTVHANFRYFALGDDLLRPVDAWFGGGADLTPYYPHLEDVLHFHQVWKDVCDRHPVADYPRFKQACDEYFYLPHRNETRGVGGIFYDYMRDDPESAFYFSRDAGRSFLAAYLPIVQRRLDLPYGQREIDFQEIRRGRYAEFNLVFDRGTRFGIETGGRTESIFMSLPPRAQWRYAWKPEPGSPEEHASSFFAPRDWLEIGADSSPEQLQED
ncbi:MAG TPA: oxygen-dependent coproporphyrinogen oxidase [Rhodothermales bacterium]